MWSFLGLFALAIQSDAVKFGQPVPVVDPSVQPLAAVPAPAPVVHPSMASDALTQSIPAPAPTTSMMISLNPDVLAAQASAEEAMAIREEVDSAVKHAEEEGFAEIKEAAHDAEEKWVAEAHMVAAQGEKLAEEARQQEIENVHHIVEEKMHHQEEVTQHMAQDIEAASDRNLGEIVDASTEYAKSATLNANAGAAAHDLNSLYESQAKVEETRHAALAYSQDALAAAEKLDHIASDAAALANSTQQTSPEANAAAVLHDVSVGLDQARHANALAQLSVAATEEAVQKVNSTLQMAQLAQEEALHYYNLAVAQAANVTGMEQREKRLYEARAHRHAAKAHPHTHQKPGNQQAAKR